MLRRICLFTSLIRYKLIRSSSQCMHACKFVSRAENYNYEPRGAERTNIYLQGRELRHEQRKFDHGEILMYFMEYV